MEQGDNNLERFFKQQLNDMEPSTDGWDIPNNAIFERARQQFPQHPTSPRRNTLLLGVILGTILLLGTFTYAFLMHQEVQQLALTINQQNETIAALQSQLNERLLPSTNTPVDKAPNPTFQSTTTEVTPIRKKNTAVAPIIQNNLIIPPAPIQLQAIMHISAQSPSSIETPIAEASSTTSRLPLPTVTLSTPPVDQPSVNFELLNTKGFHSKKLELGLSTSLRDLSVPVIAALDGRENYGVFNTVPIGGVSSNFSMAYVALYIAFPS